MNSVLFDIQTFDWSTTPLGPRECWPASLEATFTMMLDSPVAMCACWGPEQTLLYNAAYAPFLGKRHPSALGQPIAEVWFDVWNAIGPLIARALTGEAVSLVNMHLVMTRNGYEEDTWWNFSYSPLRDNGKIVGFLDIATDTTAGAVAARQLDAAETEARARDVELEKEAAARKETEEYARVNAERLQLALAAGAIIGTWVWDIPTDRFTVDEAFATAFGFDPSTGRTGISLAKVVENVHPDDQAGLAEAINEAIARGGRYAHQYRVRRHDGRYYWIEANGYVNHNADGTPGKFPGVLLNIEERRAIEAGRERAEAQLRLLNAELEKKVIAQTLARGRTWQLSPDLLGVLNGSGFFEVSNPAWQTMLGWTEEELASTPFFDLIHPDDLVKTQAAWIDAMERGIPALQFENRYRRKNGGWRWLSWVAVPDDGKIYCSARDITGDKEQAAKLRRYVDIVESDQTPTLAFDAQYRVIAFNKAHWDAFHRAFGHDAQLGETLPDLLPPDQARRLIPLLDRALAGETFTVREEFGGPGGAPRSFEINYAPLRNETGKVIGGFHHARDISAVLRANDEMEQIKDTLRQSQKMEAVGQLTGGLAHDFNNLLASISGSLELIDLKRKQGESLDLERYTSIARTGVKRAAALTHRLLAFSRRQTLAPEPLDINRIVNGMVELIERTVGPAVAIEIDLEDDPWTALVDASQLENALLNLCLNARDAMPDGGHLVIQTSKVSLDQRAAQQLDTPPGDYLVLCVRDTGTGMPESVITKAFDPFFTTKPLGEGTGLGLSMIYGFAKQSGGQVRITSKVDEGSTVCVYLPRMEGESSRDVVCQSIEMATSHAGETILVVEDESAIRMLATDTLRDLGYTVHEADDGASALKILCSDTPVDLLITDVGLPGGMNGRQVADAARAYRPRLPVLFITGYAESVLYKAGRLEADTNVLVKPFALDELSQTVKALLAGNHI